jgi:hypothetical protein
MISLGNTDRGTSAEAVKNYLGRVIQVTGFNTGDKLRGDRDSELVSFREVDAGEVMSVSQVQQFLHDAGFLPFGQIDGICGYRTTAAIRLFQEYVRTVDGDAGIGSPDGTLGPRGFSIIKSWQQGGRKADWSGGATGPSHARGIALLNAIKQRCLATPSKLLQMVNAYTGPTDTLKVAQWDFNPDQIHLVGVRKNTKDTESLFNDVFFLLIRGMVFTFIGSTDPGESDDPAGAPFLTSGQHLYRFAWHKLSDTSRVYHALKPQGKGVLVVRSRDDRVLTDSDLASGLRPNDSINVHWGGEGFAEIKKWSEGCQVITGKAYINHRNTLVDMAKYAAPFYTSLGTTLNGCYQSKGAYTVLADLVTSLSQDQDHVVRYLLLTEDELAVSPELVAMIDGARKQFGTIRQA